MKHFDVRQIREARDYADAGGQALHVMSRSWLPPSAPECFKRSHNFAHLFDRDTRRLMETARQLGVRTIVVDRPGESGQHIDLCGKPLEKAMKMCEELTLCQTE